MTMELRDLPPKDDPKGGTSSRHDKSSSEKNVFSRISPITTGLIGLLGGVLLAYVTALTEKGVSRTAMEAYVNERMQFSPYSLERAEIQSHQTRQDGDIGKLQGKFEELSKQVNRLEIKLDGHTAQKEN